MYQVPLYCVPGRKKRCVVLCLPYSCPFDVLRLLYRHFTIKFLLKELVVATTTSPSDFNFGIAVIFLILQTVNMSIQDSKRLLKGFSRNRNSWESKQNSRSCIHLTGKAEIEVCMRDKANFATLQCALILLLYNVLHCTACSFSSERDRDRDRE